VALRLGRHGIVNVRPLQGGLGLWKERQYPLERLEAAPGERAVDLTPATGPGSG